MNNWKFTFTNIIPMSKTQTVTNSPNLFSLVRLNSQLRIRNIEMDFTPPISLSVSSNSIIPTYLRDGKFYTPSFVLPRDKHYYKTNIDFEKYKFKERILKETAIADEDIKHCSNQCIGLASPPSDFCQICKKSFESYEEHLKDSSHLQKIRSSKTNLYITQLCKKVHQRYKQQNKKKYTRKIQKEGEKLKSAKGGKKQRKKKQIQNQYLLTPPMKSCTNNTNA